MLNRKIPYVTLNLTTSMLMHFLRQYKKKVLRTGQNTASLTHTMKLEILDMVNVKKEYAAYPGPDPTHRKQYFEGRMIP